MFKNAVELSHFYLKNTVKQGAFLVDATCGNGNDTVLLASLAGETGMVLGFDIQKTAIENTYLKLKECGFEKNVRLILDGHENMAEYLEGKQADAFVFNLGYLPKGNHEIHTKPDTTVKALKASLEHLKPDGIVLISIYHGKDSGFEERDAVLEYLHQLDANKYNVILHNYTNKPNFPPILALICHNKTSRGLS